MDDMNLDPKQRLLRQAYLQQVHSATQRSKDASQQKLNGCLTLLAENRANPAAYINLASCYEELNRFDDALETLREGLVQCPSTPRLYRRYAGMLAQCNRTQEAIQVARAGAQLYPEDMRFRFMERLLLPILYHRPEEVDYYRERFSAGLVELVNNVDLGSTTVQRSALEAIAKHVNFYLAYQGRDDVALQRQYGRLVERVMAAHYPPWTQPRPMPAVPADGRLRIGYVSAHFRSHSVSNTHAGWLFEHNRNAFRVYAYSMSNKKDHVTERVQRASEFRQCTGELSAACDAILADQLHILVFLDIGMEPKMTQLAALRLAPVQCVTWGHPVTSGLRSVDYFLSSELMEPPDGDDHYSERLVRLPGIGIYYDKPAVPTVLFMRNRADFGLREQAIVYLSCQSIFKYLPDHDAVFAEIAKRNPLAQFVFLVPNSVVGRDFRSRLDGAFVAAGLQSAEHCLLLPQQRMFDYWNLHLVSDVCLDSIEWSGCNSTMEAIACKLPVVTMPGRFMRGRHSYAILTQLGVTETIAKNKQEYISIAARLGLDRDWRHDVVARMVANHPRLYWDTRSISALEGFYCSVVDAKLRMQH